MQTHSKGPWEWVQVDGDYWELRDADGGQVADDGSANGEYRGWFKSSTPDADAVLMAAAPDLLAALVALTTNPHLSLDDLIYRVRDAEGKGWYGEATVDWGNAIEAARAAIAKATGVTS